MYPSSLDNLCMYLLSLSLSLVSLFSSLLCFSLFSTSTTSLSDPDRSLGGDPILSYPSLPYPSLPYPILTYPILYRPGASPEVRSTLGIQGIRQERG